ncbi:PTS lactose transporter subunit IIB [Priestia megaterium]|nr:PTS lactose transporter subunit IIB [Priestia megaterium]
MKILAVCGNGLGSSMMLAINVRKVIGSMGVKADVSNTDLASSKTETADLYIGSPEIMEQLSDGTRKTISVKNLLSLPEIEEALAKHLNA